MTCYLGIVLLWWLGPGEPSAPALRDEFRPLAFLLGSCWTGTFPDGRSTDTHCFEPMFGGRFIRDRHEVRGGKQPYSGETIYAWDAKTSQVTYTYWASDGGVSSGRMLHHPPDLIFPEAHSSDGGEITMKNVWTPRGDDAFDMVVTKRTEAGWEEMWRMSLRRVKTAERR